MSSKRSSVAIAVAMVVGSLPLAAQADITGFSGFAAPAKLLNGGGVNPNPDIGYSPDGTAFHLTNLENNVRTAGYNPTAQNITSFTASFDYTSIPALYNGGPNRVAADGFAFTVVTAANGVPSYSDINSGNSRGVRGLTNSASIMVNNFGGLLNYAGSTNVQVNGVIPDGGLGLPGPGLGVEGGKTIHFDVAYQQGILRYTITDTVTGQTLKTASTLDLPSIVGANTALIGFSGATGGYNSDQTIKNFNFVAGTGTSTGYIDRSLFTSNGTFAPIAISGGLNKTTILPAIADVAGGSALDYINATLDNGTYVSYALGSGSTFYETGIAGAAADSGLPTSGSTFTSQADSRHTFKMPTYNTATDTKTSDSLILYTRAKDVDDVGSPEGSLAFGSSDAYTGLSVLLAAGNGPASIKAVVKYSDGSTLDVGNILGPDWYNQATGVAYNAKGRIDPLGDADSTYQTGAFGLSQVDIALPISAKLITGITFTLEGASDTGTVAAIYGISGVKTGVWALNGGGDANSAGSWVGGIPNSSALAASFGNTITAPSNVIIDAPQTVAGVNFESTNAYTLTGSGSLTVDAATGGVGYVNVISGNHTINVPTTFADTSNLNARTGATLNIAKPITVAANATIRTNGAVNLNAVNGGTASAVAVNTGTTTLSGSAHVSLFSVANGATAKLAAVPGTTVIKTETLTLGDTAKLDLGDNGLIVDYTGTTSPLSTIVSKIVAGLNATGTKWTGNGINSSVAAGDATLGIGYAEASALMNNPFAGETLDSTSVLVRVVKLGDADLSGKVEFADLLTLAKNYNGTTKVWSQGDFDYNGAVGFSDLLALAKNYNQSLSASESGVVGEAFAADFALAQSLVPEPGVMLSSLGVAALGVARRRRSAR